MKSPRAPVFALAIESSNPSASDGNREGGPGVALAEVSHDTGEWIVVGEITTESLRRGAGREDDLMPAVDRVAGRAGVRPRQIGLVAVSAGPGGFTALRVAVTVGNAIAFAQGAACVSVPSASVAALRTRCAGRFAVALASKGETAFLTVFDPGWQSLQRSSPTHGRVMRATDIAGLGVELLVADQHLPDAIRRASEQAGVRIEPPVFDPAACLELACSLPVSAAGSLTPQYAREPEAVTLWKARQKR